MHLNICHYTVQSHSHFDEDNARNDFLSSITTKDVVRGSVYFYLVYKFRP